MRAHNVEVYVEEGQGTLTGQTVTDHPVAYAFECTTEILRRPGFPPVPGRRECKGQVRSLTGYPLPLGIYRLTLANKEEWRVQNDGFWDRLSDY